MSLICSLLLTFFCYSQGKKIEGNVLDEFLNPINGSLLIKKTSSPNIISEYSLIRNGLILYSLKKKYYEDIIIEISSSGFQSYSEVIEIENTRSVIDIDIQLLKSKITELKEIIIKGKKGSFEIKKDTIVFNVDAYKDGTERKVEDLLKNLPGIEVNNKTGIIKYNGKSIETVMLEGDNLFGNNYSLATKNVNIDIIQSVEAIENYSENKLLKGIENSEKVALNLKLKPSKINFSGSLNIASGYSDIETIAYNSSVDLIGINKTFKSYGMASFNNVGINTSPFNFTNVINNIETLKEINYKAREIIPETVLPETFDERRTNINKQFFSNYNSIFNLGKLLKAKVNLYSLTDSFNNFENLNNVYFLNNTKFITFDNIQHTKNPKHYRGDLKLDFSTSKTSLLEYQLSLRDETTKTSKHIFSNIKDDINSFQLTDNFFIIQKLLYTKKLSDKKALQVNFISSTNSISQELEINPSLFTSISDNQNVYLKKEYFKFKTTFLGSNLLNKYTLSIGSDLSKEPLETNFISFNNDNNNSFNSSNSIEYKKKEIYAFGENITKMNMFSLKYGFNLRYISQHTLDKFIQNSEFSDQIIFEPSLRLSYRINTNSFIQTNFGMNKNTFDSNRLFTNNILTSHRNISKNDIDLRLQNNQTYSLSYNNNNLFNQFQLELGINYLKRKGNFFTNSQINETSILTNYFFLPESIETIDFNLNFTKYIPVLKLNVKTNTYYSINNYKNVINNSDLRNNRSHSFNSELFIKTSFKKSFNIENETFYRFGKTISEIEYKNSYLHDKLKLIYNPTEQFLTTLSLDHFIPELKNDKNISLVNTKISYFIKKKNWEINFTGFNLTNVKKITIFQNDDTSTNSNSIGLIPRYFMLGINWNF